MRSALVLALVGLTSCNNPFAGGYSCATVRTPAIVVEIRDGRTGAPLANAARGAVHDGAYIDSLRPYEGSGPGPANLVSRRAADERPGTYRVEVNHPGYRTWTVGGVRAVSERCGVRTSRISASLEPSP
ncbi:MAG: hypothetical protein WKF55_01755 [Gemmatimonadaceae bacterium]